MSTTDQPEAIVLAALSERLRRLEEENRALRARLDQLDHIEPAIAPTAERGEPTITLDPSTPVGRRHVLRNGLIAAGAAAAGAVFLDAQPAAAQQYITDTMLIAKASNGDFTLQVQNPGTGTGTNAIRGTCGQGTGGVFEGTHGLTGRAFDGYSGVGVAGKADLGSGTTGTSKSGYGVYGVSTSSYGTAGRSTSNYGVVGVSANFAGVYGVSEAADQAGVRGDSVNGYAIHGIASGSGNGVVGTAVGNDGVRGHATTGLGVHGTSISGIGVKGECSTTIAVQGVSSSNHGVNGTSTSNYGVYGASTSSYGVAGRSANSSGVVGVGAVGDGVYGLSESGGGNGVKGETLVGAGLVGIAPSGVGVLLRSKATHLRLELPAGTRAAPILDAIAHQAGDIVRDSAGDLWACVAGGTPGTWRKLAGPSTAGSFHVLAAPARIYDSRVGGAQGPKAPLTNGTARVLDLKGGSSGVPAGATAALVTILLVNAATGDGNATIWANGVSKPSANTMVWGGSAKRFSTLALTALDSAARCQISASTTTDVVLDVVGYYR